MPFRLILSKNEILLQAISSGHAVPANFAYMVTAPFFLDLAPVPILLSKIGTSSVPFTGPRTKARSVPVPFQFQNFVKKFQLSSNLPLDSSRHPKMSFEKNGFADFIVSFQGQARTEFKFNYLDFCNIHRI